MYKHLTLSFSFLAFKKEIVFTEILYVLCCFCYYFNFQFVYVYIILVLGTLLCKVLDVYCNPFLL